MSVKVNVIKKLLMIIVHVIENQVLTINKKVNTMSADATESYFKLFAAMHKTKCLEKRVIYVSKRFEASSI